MQRYSDVVQDRQGNALSGVSVLVQTEAGASATLYADNGVTPKANPLTTDADGEFSFYAADGVYTLNFSGGGVVPETKEVQVWDYRINGPKLALSVAVEDFGAVGDGTTDDTTAIQAAINAVAAAGGGSVSLSKRYRIASNLTIARQVSLVGQHVHTDMTDRAYWASIGSALLVASTATLTMQNGSGLKGLAIQRYGMTFPNPLTASDVAQYAGKAITLNSAGAYVGYCSIMGFEYAVFSDGLTNRPRHRMEFVYIDCTNGVVIDNDLGGCSLYDVHCLPFLTASDADNVRSGTAFLFKNISDWTQCVHCFDLGHFYGFKVEGANSVTFLGCGADYPKTLDNGYGFHITGSSTLTQIIACQSASRLVNVYVDTNNGDITSIRDSVFWSSTNQAILVEKGDANITGNHFYSFTGDGVAVNDANSRVLVDGNTFDTMDSAIVRVSALELIHGRNMYRSLSNGSSNVQSGRALPTLASAGTLIPGANEDVVKITGTTTIGTISGLNAWPGRRLTLVFESALTVSHGSSIKLNGSTNMSATAGSSLTLVHETGNVWYEASRMVA